MVCAWVSSVCSSVSFWCMSWLSILTLLVSWIVWVVCVFWRYVRVVVLVCVWLVSSVMDALMVVSI